MAPNDRLDLAGLFAALDAQVRAGHEMARASVEGVARLQFLPYFAFRRQVEETLSLIIVLEDHLEAAAEDARTEPLRAELTRLDLALMSLYLRTVRDFFAAAGEAEALPLGARYLFQPDLANLAGTRQRLSAGRYRDGHHDLDCIAAEAVRLALGVIEQAPPWPEFSTPLLPAPPAPGLIAKPRSPGKRRFRV